MNTKLVVLITFVLILVSVLPISVYAATIIGVNSGDWIEYDSNFSGNVPPPHPTGYTIEVVSVCSDRINLTVDIKTHLSDDTLTSVRATITLETGGVELFIIPANLKSSDTFFDKDIGTITIIGIEDKIYADANRQVVYASIQQENAKMYWDKATGILVEANISMPEYSQTIIIRDTNKWSSGPFGLHPSIFYSLIILVIVIITISAFVLIQRRS